KLAVLFCVFALDHDDKIVLGLELVFETNKILMIFFVCSHQVVSAGVKFQPEDRVDQTDQKKQNLRIEKPLGITTDPVGQPPQPSNRKRVGRSGHYFTGRRHGSQQTEKRSLSGARATG